MTTFHVSPSVLAHAGTQLSPAASALASTTCTVPNPAMYGSLVGSAAADCEPATTQSFNDLIKALSELYDGISHQLGDTSECYQRHEDELVTLIRGTIEGMLR